MRIINMEGFTDEERLQFLPTILSNVIGGMLSIMKLMQEMGIEVVDSGLFQERLEQILETTNCKAIFEQENNDLFEFIKEFYGKESVKEFLVKNFDCVQYAETISYYQRHIDTILSRSYVPSVDDILYCRLRTTGIHEINFSFKAANICMVDVGGQRSERRKWIHCFEDVDAVIFCISLNEYNMKLDEDCTKNAMQESLDIFKSIINSKWFKKTQILLFLNKVDIFKEKIANYPLTEYFVDFTGQPNSVEDSVDYIKEKYLSLDMQENRTIFAYPTCATNTKNIEMVTSLAFQNVLKKALAKLGVF